MKKTPVESSKQRRRLPSRDGASKVDNGQPALTATALATRLKHKIEFASPSSLIPYEKNPTLHPVEQVDEIVRSIKEFGFTVPILVDENKMILAGHGRQLAALEMKLATVPIIRRAGLTPDQKRAYVLADNKIARNAEFDWQLVAGELTALKDAGFNLDLTGFKDFEYEPLLQADWSPPAADDTDISDYRGVSFFCTKEQAGVVRKAMEKVRKDTGDDEASDGRCLELISADFIAGP
jgi:hypothetical protein